MTWLRNNQEFDHFQLIFDIFGWQRIVPDLLVPREVKSHSEMNETSRSQDRKTEQQHAHNLAHSESYELNYQVIRCKSSQLTSTRAWWRS
jgi:hypothetical protein